MSVSEAGSEHQVPLWVRSSSSQEVDATAEARFAEQNRSEDERNRLLYVALTRAEDRLIVAGLAGKPNRDGAVLPETAWYRRIDAGFAAFADAIRTVPGPDGTAIRRVSAGVLREGAQPIREAVPSSPIPQGSWLLTPAPIEFEPAPPITASSQLAAADGETADLAMMPLAGVDQPALRLRGLLAHLLLQHLPSVAAGKRQAAAIRLAASAGGAIPPELRDRIIAGVLAMLDYPDLAELFGSDSLAEVPIAGTVTLASGVHRQADGRIDRLLVTSDAVLFADFKTSAAAPDDLDKVPASVMRQMAIYAALLRAAFPGRSVSGLLIYTSGPRLLRLEPDVLAATPIDSGNLFKAA
jgi:ATP-dependent helicase/nuclease subunit A